MTFSQSVKQELYDTKYICDQCGYAFVFGVLHFSKQDSEQFLYKTDQEMLASLLAEKIVEDIGVIVTNTDPNISAKRKYKQFVLTIEDAQDQLVFQKRYRISLDRFLQSGVLGKQCCKNAFLRGVYIACGTIVNPKKEYHMEFKLADAVQAQQLLQILHEEGQRFRHSKRKGNQILYLKESEQIEDMLTYLGAVKHVFELMNIKIEKDLRNQVNRITNCETANIQKTVTASMRQVEDIRYINQVKGLSFLQEELRQTAETRLENPELSLKELCEIFPFSISRSGLNHRLRKLSQIAEELRETEQLKEVANE